MNTFTAVMFIIIGLSFMYLQKKGAPGGFSESISFVPVSAAMLYMVYLCCMPGEQLYNVGITTYAGILLISSAIAFRAIQSSMYFALSQLFILLTLGIAFFSFIGDVYGSDLFIKEDSVLIMDFGTSVLFLLFSISMLLSTPDKGIMEVYLNKSENGILLRRLSVIITVLPVAAGWLGLYFEDSGIYTKETGDTIFIFLLVATPLVMIWRNLHLLHRSEKKLRQSRNMIFDNEMKLRAIIEHTHDAIYIKDLNGKYLMVNPAAAEIVGLSPEEMTGKTDRELFDDEACERIERIDKEITGENMTYTYETPIHVKGKTLYSSTTKFPYYSPTGKIIGVIGISRDITEKKKTENELLMLSLLARYTTNGVLITDKYACIEWANDGFIRNSGYTLEEVKGKKPNDFLEGPLTPEEAKKGLIEGVMRGVPFTQETVTYRKDGTWYNTSVEITPIKNSMGEVERYVVVETNITEKVKARDAIIKAKEAAERTGRAKEEFLANMSHEIRTPMNAIIGFTDLLLKSSITGEERKYLDLIKTSGENLLTIINDILDFSKLEAKKLTIVKRNVSIKEILNIVCELLSIDAKQKGLDIVVDVDDRIPSTLYGDATRLNQILLNLLSNAIKFTHKGSINISAALIINNGKEAQVEFRVKDTGIGIPRDKISTIFESFSQASSDTARMYGGTGLGLAIVKRLLQLMGGEIAVKSMPDKGSEFIFRLPFEIVKENRLQPVTRPGSKIAKTGRKLKLLIAEDNPVNVILIKKIISTFGFEADVAGNGRIALERIKRHTYDLVLMDIQMPEMDGLTATKIIRKEYSRTLPIIAITASMLTSDKDKCFAAGMNDFISKPFNADELYHKIINCTSEFNRIPA
jgi:PAS domain S-box-containing protein